MIFDQRNGRRRRLLQGAREAARQPDLDRRDRLPLRLARRAVARRARAAAADREARSRASMTALVLGGLIAIARGPARRAAVPPPSRRADDDRIDAPNEAAEQRLLLDRAARPRARGAEGARVRPPHRQDRRRRLPRHGRPAAPRGRRRAARARRAHGKEPARAAAGAEPPRSLSAPPSRSKR